MRFRIDAESFPGLKEIICQILFFIIVEDASFYWSHRTLHTPYFFSKIHKVHHEYYNSISIAAIYAHPLEYLFGNIVPTALGFTLLGSRTHFATVLMW